MGENREAEYLRSLLARLEWSAGDYEHGDAACCPVCRWWKEHGHDPAGCELGAAIRPTEG